MSYTVNCYEFKAFNWFAETGKFKPESVNKFIGYYNDAAGIGGPFKRSEKALISLTIMHYKQRH